MRILKIDEKNKFISVIPETLDDLWHLSRIIEANDIVKGLTSRKIKAEEGREARREKIFIELKVEKTEFHEFSKLLRIAGIILAGKPAELLEINSHQSLELELNERVDLLKNDWKLFQIERLKKAELDSKKKPFVVVVLDDERADIAFLKEFKLELKVSIKSKKTGKRFKEEEWQNNYFSEIFSKLKELSPERLIIAGPGFTKEDFFSFLKEKMPKIQLFLESVNSIGVTGLNELLKGKAIQKIISELEIVKDNALVDAVLKELGKSSGLAEYGFNEIEKALSLGAISELLVSDSFLLKNKEKIEQIMLSVEKMKGKVHIISTDNDAGKKLESLGGIAALLRFPVS